MKQLRSSVFILFLMVSSSFVWAQDTIVLRNGGKMGVKVVSVNTKVIYSIPPDKKTLSISQSKIDYIKYADGSRYSVDESHQPYKLKPYISITGGAAYPWNFSGYGASTYYSGYDGYGYSGYANNGNEFSLTGGLKIGSRGWEFTGMVSYIRNRISAPGILDETMANFGIGSNFVYYDGYPGIIPTGTYAYSNFPVLVGITKNWGKRKVHVGMSMLAGILITYTPAISGTFMGQYRTTGNTYNTAPYSVTLNSETQNNFIFEMGIHVDVDITSRVFLRFLLECQASGLDNYGGYQFVDLANGNSYTGTYSGEGSASSSFFVGLTNLSLGLGYKL